LNNEKSRAPLNRGLVDRESNPAGAVELRRGGRKRTSL